MKQACNLIGVCLICVTLGWWWGGVALAQDGGAGDPDAGGPTSATPIERSSAATKGTGEISLSVRAFGLGDRPRPGDWLGVRIGVDDSGSKARNVAVRISVPDLDGDIAQMQRVIVANPGAVQQVWLYLRPGFADLASNTFDVTAHEAIEDEISPGASQTYTIGRLLGRTRYQVANSIHSTTGLIGVVGGRTAGLEQYDVVRDGPPSAYGNYAVTGDEVTEVIGGLKATELPDRWMGYAQLQALVWTGSGSDEDPSLLDSFKANAVREYVRRGGHLIVVLPPVGQKWYGQPTFPLADIMPEVKVTRLEGVDLAPYRSLLTRDSAAALPQDAVVHVLEPEATGSYSAMPIMVGEDGRPVVVRRSVGAGMVTVIGLDVSSSKLHSISRAFMTDQFWNRILGKRLRVLNGSEMNAMNSPNRKMPNGKDPPNYSYQSGGYANIDTRIVGAITNQARAASGLLLAGVLFVAYWLFAGPLGYVILKQRNMKQHAWVGFVAATAVFTLIAWGGASLLKPRRVHGQHFSVIDSVYGQPDQRAKMWASVFLPRYGEQTLSSAASSGAGVDWNNTISSWDAAGTPTGGGGFAVFPDSRGYLMDARKPDTMSVPARATSKQIQIDWAGVLPANWQMPRPLADASVPIGKEIVLTDRPDAKAGERKWALSGTIVHNLPAPLRDGWVAVIASPRVGGTFEQMRYLAACSDFSTWAPNQPLDLAEIFKVQMPREGTRGEGAFPKDLRPAPSMSGIQIAGSLSDENADLALTFFDMIEPPEELSANESKARVVMRREASHGLDLSKWCTQPCVIVVGVLGSEEPQECPVPFTVDGIAPDELRSRIKGRTLVRWVYPLTPNPVKPVVVKGTPTPAAPAEPSAQPETPGGGTGG